MEWKVGCCGFAAAQRKYYREFGLVELQSTFYKLPMPKTAERWRSEAPQKFEFAVKAWQAITHPPTSPTWRKSGLKISPKQADRYGLLKPTKENLDAWHRTLEVCKILKARICVIQCPPQFGYSKANVRSLTAFMRKIDREGLRIGWEPRGDWKLHTDEVGRLCKELDMIHVVDILRRDPATVNSLLYTRLHGLGPREFNYRYEYSESDLANLRDRLQILGRDGVKEAYVLFNNVSMLRDAKRFIDMVGPNGSKLGGVSETSPPSPA